MNSIKTSISKVKALLKQGKINDAHLILSELLIYDPQNKYVKKTIKKIETNENFSKTNVNSDLNNMINKIVNFYQNNQIENAIVEVEKAYSEHPNSAVKPGTTKSENSSEAILRLIISLGESQAVDRHSCISLPVIPL